MVFRSVIFCCPFGQHLLTKWPTKYHRSKDHHMRNIFLCIYNLPISPKLTKIFWFEVRTFFEKKIQMRMVQLVWRHYPVPWYSLPCTMVQSTLYHGTGGVPWYRVTCTMVQGNAQLCTIPY